MKIQLMLGNEAVARGAWEAGARVASAYPGTPSTEITETIAKTYPEIYAEWAPNEKVALEVGVGASIGGSRALVCMKHVGLNVAADPLFTAAYTGVNGGLVIVVADDPGMHSSQNEQDSRFYALSAHIPMLEPSDSQECLDFTRRAFEISERFDTPVLLRLTTRVAHARSRVLVGEPEAYEPKPYVKDVNKYVMMPGMARMRHLEVERHMNALGAYALTAQENRSERRDSKVGIVTSGIAYQYTREALPTASTLKLGLVHPLPLDLLRDFADTVDTLYVVEELEPLIERQLKAHGINCSGKEQLGVQGELSAAAVARAFGQSIEEQTPQDLPARPPVLCPGCPHRGAFAVMGQLKLRVFGDIGCYTLGTLAPLSAMDACLCMGASIGMAHGMDKAGAAQPGSTVAVIGDSTFLHSGVTGLMNIVYNQGTSTVVVLDNSTTGMTGHQPNPMTGKTIRLQDTPPVDLEMLCRALGVRHVRTVDPFDMDALKEILMQETQRPEPSVVICRRPCALLKRSGEPKLRISDKCRNCKACMRIGCPAIEDVDGAVRINPALCAGCGLCAKMCKFGAMEKAGERV